MTLILSAHKRDAVVQASDRLVSQITVGRGLRPLDVVANKSVVYLASDAIVAVGFSGRAFLNNRRTDLWLTEVLTGMEFEEGGSIVFFVGGHGTTDVWHACQRVREEAERAFRPMRHAPHTAHAFVFSGWQRRRKGTVQPFLWRLENSRAAPDRFQMFNLLRHARDWWVLTTFTPTGSFRPDSMDDLLERLKDAQTAEAVENELVRTIRGNAATVPGVGANCLVVRLVPDRQPNVVVRYVPTNGSTFATKTMAGEPRILPYIFTPWIIGEGVLMPPSLSVGSVGGMTSVGGLTCRFDAPTTPDAAGYGFSSHSIEDLRRLMYGKPGL